MTYTRCTMSHYIALLSAIGRAAMSRYLPNHAALSSPRNRIAIATAIAELRRTRADWCWDDRHTEQSRIAEHLWKMTASALDLDVDEAVVCANPACPTPTAYASLACGGCTTADAPVYDSKQCQIGACPVVRSSDRISGLAEAQAGLLSAQGVRSAAVGSDRQLRSVHPISAQLVHRLCTAVQSERRRDSVHLHPERAYRASSSAPACVPPGCAAHCSVLFGDLAWALRPRARSAG